MTDLTHQAQQAATDLWRGFTEGERNVGDVERVVSALAGAGMMAWGVRQGGVSGLVAGLVGAGLAMRGATGHCPIYAAMEQHGDEGIDARRTQPVGSGADALH